MRGCYDAGEVPANSVLLLPTWEEAVSFPRGALTLGFCRQCGFVANTSFDRRLTEYSSRYEETQGFSPTFRRWHRALAERLVARHDLRRKRIVEIGCGKGEFLALLCELGDNEGIGYDPSFAPDRLDSPAASRMRFVRDFYTEDSGGHGADFVCCKMTLEHIPDVARFVARVRRSLDDAPETVVFFQVPDLERILEERAFWDVYYEHCSYFTAGSLARVFRRAGFEVLSVRREYGGQYLTLEARPAPVPDGQALGDEDARDVARLSGLVADFERGVADALSVWTCRLDAWRDAERRVVPWGSGSKGVAFLTALGGRPEIEHVVDVNPHKHGCFMAGTGQEIVSPARLELEPPDVVVVMNPLYREEIEIDLGRRGLAPEVVTA